MKVIKGLAGLALAFTSQIASADYQCASQEGFKTLKVYEGSSTRLGGDNTVVLSGQDGFIDSWGGFMTKEGSLFMEKHIEFINDVGSLVITHSPVFSPAFCGRGACDPDPIQPIDETIYAKLILADGTTTFQCHETEF